MYKKYISIAIRILISTIAAFICFFIISYAIATKIATSQNVANEKQIIMQYQCPQKSFTVRMTAYTLDPKETSSDPTKTATMTTPIPGKTLAISRDLIPHMLGKKVFIEGHGVWVAEDLMNKRYEKSIDLCLTTKEEAYKIGAKEVIVVVLE